MLARFDRTGNHLRLTKAALERPQISDRPGKSHLDHPPTPEERAGNSVSVYAVVEGVDASIIASAQSICRLADHTKNTRALILIQAIIKI